MSAGEQSGFPLGKWLLVSGLALVANSAYVAAFSSPNVLYISNDLLHPFLGIAVAVLLAAFGVRHRGYFAGAAVRTAIALLAVAAALGVYLAFTGMTRPHSVELYLHVGLMTAGLFFLLVHLRGRVRRSGVEARNSKIEAETAEGGSSPGSRLRSQASDVRVWRWCAGVTFGSLIFYAAAAGYQHFFPNSAYTISNPSTAPLTMNQEGGGASSFMFPPAREGFPPIASPRSGPSLIRPRARPRLPTSGPSTRHGVVPYCFQQVACQRCDPGHVPAVSTCCRANVQGCRPHA